MRMPISARHWMRTWSSDTASLRRHGSLLIWLDKEMTGRAPHDGSRGRPEMDADAAIIPIRSACLNRLSARATADIVRMA